jgi:phytoene desaturase (3,4-didehydrolycopene-forming)
MIIDSVLRAMNTVIPELETHNVFLAAEFQDSFDSIFKSQSIPNEPSFYVNVPSRIDPSAAPEGKDSVVVLVPVGHLLKSSGQGPLVDKKGLAPKNEQDWEGMIHKAREAIFATVESRTGANLRECVVKEIVNEPYSWESRFNLDKGAILGLSHSFFNVLSFRPRTKHGSYRNLYFVGASTHPGTGVPIVLAGSKITTEQILDDLGMANPWRSSRTDHPRVDNIDRVRRPFSPLYLLLLFTVASLIAYWLIKYRSM